MVVYGMNVDEMVFWIAPLDDSDHHGNVLCQRHADVMVVPGGWNLDDRRQRDLHLFNPRVVPSSAEPPRQRRRRRASAESGEQLQIDGTQPAPPADQVQTADSDPDGASTDAVEAWSPNFDVDDDLDGLLDVSSPLLSRAFRGQPRKKP